MTSKTAKVTRRFARTPNPQLSTAGDDAGKQVVPQEAEGGSELIAAIPIPRPESKIALVIRLLERTEGASLAELVTATGWLPHTARAALTGRAYRWPFSRLRTRDEVAGHIVALAFRDDLAPLCERLARLFEGQLELGKHIESHNFSAHETSVAMLASTRIASILRSGYPSSRIPLLAKLIERVELQSDSIAIGTSTARLLTALEFDREPAVESASITLTCATTKVWHGRQLRLVIPGPTADTGFRHRDPNLVRLIAEVHEARLLVLANTDKTISAIARDGKRDRVRLNRVLALACLAPDIITAILEGRQPFGLSSTALLRTDLPLDWAEQRVVLGFA